MYPISSFCGVIIAAIVCLVGCKPRSQSSEQSLTQATYNKTAEFQRMQDFIRNTTAVIERAKSDKKDAEKIVMSLSAEISKASEKIEQSAPNLHMACAQRVKLKCIDLLSRYINQMGGNLKSSTINETADVSISKAIQKINDSIKNPKYKLDKFGNIAVIMYRLAAISPIASRVVASHEKSKAGSRSSLQLAGASQFSLWEDDGSGNGGGGGGGGGPKNVFGGDLLNPMDPANLARDLADGQFDGTSFGIPTSLGGFTNDGNPFASVKIDPSALIEVAGAILTIVFEIPRAFVPSF